MTSKHLKSLSHTFNKGIKTTTHTTNKELLEHANIHAKNHVFPTESCIIIIESLSIKTYTYMTFSLNLKFTYKLNTEN